MNKEKKMPEMVGVFSELAYSFIDYKRSLGYSVARMIFPYSVKNITSEKVEAEYPTV